MREPDYYLASTEGYNLERPRCCWKIARVEIEGTPRREGDLVRLRPALPALEPSSKDVDKVVLTARHEGFSVEGIKSWPLYVYVLQPKRDSVVESILAGNPQHMGDFTIVAWAEIYESWDSAIKKTM